MDNLTQNLGITFPAVTRETQSLLITKLHAVMCEMEELYGVRGQLVIQNTEA